MSPHPRSRTPRLGGKSRLAILIAGILAVAFLTPPVSCSRHIGTTPDPVAPKGALAIPNTNVPAEPWQADAPARTSIDRKADR